MQGYNNNNPHHHLFARKWHFKTTTAMGTLQCRTARL